MTKALLVLEDGSVFHGSSIGANGQTVGEVVFNTSMTGYQEILTDASYARQIITLTYPHIGNVGCNTEDQESSRVWAAGLVIRDSSLITSNWRNQQSLSDYLTANNVVAIAGIDTRRLTRLLREKGALSGCIYAGDSCDVDAALAAARQFEGLKNMDLAKVVTTGQTYDWSQASWGKTAPPSLFHVVVYDFGVKHNILRNLIDSQCRVTVVPATTSAEEVFALNPDGIVLSNGPGDPEPCTYAIAAIQTFLERGIPIFGICLGHQLLGLAAGAQTVKMKFGHHGANHPVQDIRNNQVYITSQNHGFMIDEASLPPHLEVTHRSLFDNSLQGIRHREKPAFSFQGHPEASPGPEEISSLFQEFIGLMRC